MSAKIQLTVHLETQTCGSRSGVATRITVKERKRRKSGVAEPEPLEPKIFCEEEPEL